MSGRVKPVRRYDSPKRRAQAETTRHEILEAARRLFERDGYAATSMAAIAAEAGVALKTVYVAFETKSGLLRALWHRRLRGELETVPVGEQPRFRELLDERDPERVLRLNARNSMLVKRDAAALMDVIRSAAPADEEIGALWRRIQVEFHANQRTVVERLHELGALRGDLDVETATDTLWALNHPTLYGLLAGERAWTDENYERWLGDLFCEQLLARGRR
jgi:AcrR family transcriptional regulator